MDDDDRMLDRSPMDELISNDDCTDDLDSDDEENEGTITSEGERIIYPWMKKIHVAGGEIYFLKLNFKTPFCDSFYSDTSLNCVVVVVVVCKRMKKISISL